MGCGACMNGNVVEQPIQPLTPVASILQSLVNKYIDCVSINKLDDNNKLTQDQKTNKKSYIQNENLNNQNKGEKNKQQKHPVLSVQQCKTILDLIASTNGQLPTIQIKEKKMQVGKDSKNQEFESAYAAGTIPCLLTYHQRILWKCLLIIPQHLQQCRVSQVKIPKFASSISDEQQIVQNSFYQISLDVNRTFPKNQNLRRADLTILLKNIVNCICGIGYTQGMNFYAGFLLLCGFTVEEAYYIFIFLFIRRQFFIAHNYNVSFKQVQTSNLLLSNSLSQRLVQHLKQLGIDQQIYSFAWFLCSFLYTLEVQTCIIIWDFMIKSGCCQYAGGGFVTILNVAVLMMERLEQRILQIHTPDGLLTFLRQQNINKIFTSVQIMEIIKQLQRRSAKWNKNNEYKIIHFIKQKQLGKQTEAIFRKYLITTKDLFENDNQFKMALTTKEGYDKYLNQVFGLSRSSKNTLKIKANTKEKQQECEQVVHVGNPNIKLVNSTNNEMVKSVKQDSEN